MKYEITITPEEKENSEITLSLNTANEGQFEIKSYGSTMNFSQFLEFADAIQEIRQKFTLLTSKQENDDNA